MDYYHGLHCFVVSFPSPYSILLMSDAIDSMLDASSSSKIESKASSFDFGWSDHHLASILDGLQPSSFDFKQKTKTI